jgi:tetratricopeptide (TPR) repeat protein
MATATELFHARHYPGVVALASEALECDPDHVPMLLLRARARIALHLDLEAQADLRDVIRLEPQNPLAYRLLGNLAARRDERESAAIFFREALRLDPTDIEAQDWLRIVGVPSSRPAAAANKLPAPAAAAGRILSPKRTARPRAPLPPPLPRARTGDDELATEPVPRPRLATGSEPNIPTGPRVALPRPRTSIPELAGFGEYLVAIGILTHERLRAAQAYQRSAHVQLSTAIVTLGLATPERVEWAAVAHQAQLGGAR